MIKITEVEKKLGKGVYFCEYCQTYQSEQTVPKRQFIKWDVCRNCHNTHINKKERKESIKAKREAKRKNAQFTIELEKAKDLKYIIDAITNIHDEGRIIFNSEGMHVVAMDPSRICVASLHLTSKYFNKFEISVEKQFISINFDDLRKVFEKIDEDAPIRLTTTTHKDFSMNQEARFLSIRMDKREFELVLLDSSYSEDIPDKNLLNIKYPCDFTLATDKFKTIIDNASLYSELIYFKVNESELKITSEGKEGKFTYTHNLSETVKEKIDVALSLTFLRTILPVITFVPEIKIYLETDNPIRIDLQFAKLSSLFYFQAPRVDE